MIIRNHTENENAKIWRYMDFTKFVNILETKSLFFVRSDKFEDPYEGSYPKYYRAGHLENLFTLASMLDKVHFMYGYDELVIIAKLLRKEPTPNDHEYLLKLGKMMRDVNTKYNIVEIDLNYYADGMDDFYSLLQNMIRLTEEGRRMRNISCWHMNEDESDAMWKLYLKSTEGVAIQSTIKKFIDCLETDTTNTEVGSVEYIDYETEKFSNDDFNAPFFSKRRSFQHEREFRAVRFDVADIVEDTPIPYDFGVNIPVNLETLIENVYVSPTSPGWFLSLVESITQKYGVKQKPIQSKLMGIPIF